MKQILTNLGITTIGKLGRCQFCMRAAFKSAMALWLVVGAFLSLTPWTAIAMTLMPVAAALTALWLAHLLAYAARTARWQNSVADPRRAIAGPGMARREFLPLFVRALAFMALATTLPVISKPASAESTCPAGAPNPCGAKWCCSSPSRFHCEGYTGSVPAWRQRGHFCVQTATLEEQADLRSNCAVLIQC